MPLEHPSTRSAAAAPPRSSVDGGIHRGQREHGLARDRDLASTYRVRVLRLDADLVERDVFAAVAIVRAALVASTLVARKVSR